MSPWIYGSMLVAGLLVPHLGSWWWRRRHPDGPRPWTGSSRRRVAAGRFLFEGHSRFVGYALQCTFFAALWLGSAWALSQPMSPKTSNQMDPPMQVSAWVTYPVGVVGLLVSAAVAIRENEHHEEARLRRHHTTDKASIPPVDGGWHP